MVTLAGSTTGGYTNGPGRAARFTFPSGKAIISKGDIIVADSLNNAIRRIALLAGANGAGYTDGTLTLARLNCPFGISIDASETIASFFVVV
jgi:hypothetical protein